MRLFSLVNDNPLNGIMINEEGLIMSYSMIKMALIQMVFIVLKCVMIEHMCFVLNYSI